MGFKKAPASPQERFPARGTATLLVLGTLLFPCIPTFAQVFTVERDHAPGQIGNLKDIQPTSVPLGTTPLSERSRQELIRLFQSDQAFAVRPLPLGNRGLTLHANGPLSPSGNAYADELDHYGISSKPGGRLLISKFEIKSDRILFEFNGGPEKHHHILQHIEVGSGIGTVPLGQDDGETPVGSRLVVVFNKFVPDMEPFQLWRLIAPLVDFSLKTPAQAFADTLPPKLKSAVLDHEVLVGMNRDMVMHAVGRPDRKIREMNGSALFEEWIYGDPPHEVQFVRFNGNRVVRLEIADVGQEPIIRDKDETDGYFQGEFVHEVRLGDAVATPPGQETASRAAPTLRQPGEKLPDGTEQQQLRRVKMPPPDSAAPPSQPAASQPSASAPATAQSGTAASGAAQPAASDTPPGRHLAPSLSDSSGNP